MTLLVFYKKRAVVAPGGPSPSILLQPPRSFVSYEVVPTPATTRITTRAWEGELGQTLRRVHRTRKVAIGCENAHAILEARGTPSLSGVSSNVRCLPLSVRHQAHQSGSIACASQDASVMPDSSVANAVCRGDFVMETQFHHLTDEEIVFLLAA